MGVIMGTRIVVPDTKIPPDMSVFTKEKCERAEDWYKKYNIPIIIPNQTWIECKKMYKEYRARRIFWRRRSDEAAMRYFGMTNEEVYRRLKHHFEKDGKYSREEVLVKESFSQYDDTTSMMLITEYMKNDLGPVDVERLKSVVESMKPKTVSIEDMMIQESPYFTPEEIYNLRGTYASQPIPGFKYDSWLEEYNLFFNGVEAEKFMGLGLERVKLLQKFGFDEKPDKKTKESMLRLGWNPEIPYTEENRVKAYDRMKSILEHRCNVQLVDFTKIQVPESTPIEESDVAYPYAVYIVFKRSPTIINGIIAQATNSYWAHAAISFDPKLKMCYTFDMFDRGFAVEDVHKYHPGTVINVIGCLVSKKGWNAMRNTIQHYSKIKKDTSYGFANFAACLTKKANENTKSMVCSNFVDYMLKIGGISPSTQSWSIMHPGRLRRSIAANNVRRFYELYKGPVEEFNPGKAQNIMYHLSHGTLVTEDKDIAKMNREIQDLYKTMIEPYVGMEVIEESISLYPYRGYTYDQVKKLTIYPY